MPDLHHLLLFITAGLVLNLTPGPDVMFIVANAVRGGLRAGVAAALGIGAGCLVHVTAAAAGVSALLAASSAAFSVLKWVGALYLVWVGVKMLRGALKRPAGGAAAGAVASMTAAGISTTVAGMTSGLTASAIGWVCSPISSSPWEAMSALLPSR